MPMFKVVLELQAGYSTSLEEEGSSLEAMTQRWANLVINAQSRVGSGQAASGSAFGDDVLFIPNGSELVEIYFLATGGSVRIGPIWSRESP